MSKTESPVTGGPCTIVERIPIKSIIDIYAHELNIDVSEEFLDIDVIYLCKCEETGYRFFYPHRVAGSPEFYRKLYDRESSEAWAYKHEKWEFTLAIDIAKTGVSRLLDVGAGSGNFLQLASKHVEHCVGLETNPYGLKEAKEKDLTAVNQTIEEHSYENEGGYDMITAFQVLEHIPDVHGFITACVLALKPDGRLFIAVPNNGGFIGLQKNLPLNLPPHHVGLWERESLEALAGIFGIQVSRIEHEPLADDNLDWYAASMEDLFLPNSRILRSLYYRLGLSKFFRRFVAENRRSIHGHTIAAIYKKPRVAMMV